MTRKNIIVGCAGIIGNTTLKFFRDKYDNFYGTDKILEGDWNIPLGSAFSQKSLGWDPKKTLDNNDVIWICTREENVEDVIKEYKDYAKNFVIRSTLPRDLFYLPEKYPYLNIVHVPEFLRENFALEDMEATNRVVIGGNAPELKIYLKELFQDILPNAHIISELTFKESCLVKLFSNNYLATVISFWNEMGRICKKEGKYVNAEMVASVCAMDSRISEYGTIPGAKFGGMCLPKDLNHILNDYNGLVLLKAVKEVNEKMV